MSMIVLTAGLLDSFQDRGRTGWRHWGINPGGAMDWQAMQQANIVLNNKPHEAVLELHFPASTFLMETNLLLALAGADFGAELDGEPVALYKPFWAMTGSVLKFTHRHRGQRAYLAVKKGWKLNSWLNSCSTHLQLQTGGFHGRALQKTDRIGCSHEASDLLKSRTQFGWGIAERRPDIDSTVLRVVTAKDWPELSYKSRQFFAEGRFEISKHANRMGYQLNGPVLKRDKEQELFSFGVNSGAIQLLPNGQLIILMADHQVTGGYPVIGYVISVDLPKLAQWGAGKKFTFSLSSLSAAEQAEEAQRRDRRLEQFYCSEKWKQIADHRE